MIDRARLAIPLLATCGFAVVTTEFVVVGILPMIARDFSMTISEAGLLLTLWAFTVAICGPPLTALLGGISRRPIFVSVMVLFALTNLVAALAPDVWVLAAARFGGALALPVFWSMATATAARIAGPEHAGRAVAHVFTGISIATVIGIPLGTLAAESFGWRWMFGGIAILCVVLAGLMLLLFPRTAGEPQPILQQAAILKRPSFLAHLLLATAVFTGMFTAYTYLADILQRRAGYDGRDTGLVLIGFGAFGLLGNWLTGLVVDQRPMSTTVVWAAAVGIAMALVVPVAENRWLLLPVLALWGTAHGAGFVANSVRVMKAGADAPAFAMATNASVCNLGIGLGAILGGRVISGLGLPAIGAAGAALIVLSLVLAAYVATAMRPAPPALGPAPSQ